MAENINTEENTLSTSIPDDDEVPYLTEDIFMDITETCKSSNRFSKLNTTLRNVYSNMSSLSRSFRTTNTSVGLDYPSLKRVYSALFELPSYIYEMDMMCALDKLAKNLEKELQNQNEKLYSDVDIVDILFMVFMIEMDSSIYLDSILSSFCLLMKWTTVGLQAKLAQVWAGPGASSLHTTLKNLNTLISRRVIDLQLHPTSILQEEDVITGATKIVRILYYANMLAGVLEPNPTLNEEDENDLSKSKIIAPPVDELAAELGINELNCRKPLIPFKEFYNEPLSDFINMDKDFCHYKLEYKFSFMRYPFMLLPQTKTLGLFYDNRLRMFSEKRNSFLNVTMSTKEKSAFRLRVRRDHIINDALIALDLIITDDPMQLKKQLFIEFENEEGIDEGGISKEFFQLIVEDIFNLDYGMFTFQEDSQAVWFNPTSFVPLNQFKMVGIVLGLAIYNNVILSLNFPMVLYRKLKGKAGSFEDLAEWNPTLYRSLKQLLDYTGDDIEEEFMLTFRVNCQDIFGNLLHHDLVENGDETLVSQENKHKFVELYADYLLNKSVEKQFQAFHEGFRMVVDKSPLDLLFRPEEIELLICGSQHFDFNELEYAVKYDNGYTSNSQIIRHFWSVVREFTTAEQKKLLQFTTGSDRVPIGGLRMLKIVISRSGVDSNFLPTAHTCYNVLLLPEYTSREKLRERLTTSISNYKGFGLR